MKRLQISLEPELDEALGHEANRMNVSKAEIVRQCLRERIKPGFRWEDDPLFKLFGTGTGPGLAEGETIDDVVYGKKVSLD